ncbi:RNA-binding protein NOB1 [Thalassophryne amazonica]|uniref:RNA-binding protein NOB1 n=1 Tax=Thalassophryne amazonica TaxID=390379 RepID=UPI001471B6BC|nr:RNA-binding protein NOB1 [Thalassophryne amazonica]
MVGFECVNIDSTQCRPEAPVNVAGFHFPSRKPADSLINRQTEKEAETSRPANHEEFNSFHFWRVPLPSLDEDLLSLLEPVDNKHKEADAQSHAAADDEEFNSFRFWRDPIQSVDDELLDSLKVGGVSESNSRTDRLQTEEGVEHKQAEEQSPDENKENEPEDGDDDDDEGGGWITASNITQVKMESADCMAPADVKVACLTTDFAMQNVLIQVGLHILSVSGMLIKQARNHILRCHACFRTTTNMAKVFCPHCGNKTLKKLAVTISEDGGMQMHFSRNPKVLNPRGLRYSLPLPQGGKHANNPHLVEDQRFPQQRLSRKARQKTDVFNPDYLAGASPFCENDIYSRAANLQIRDSQCGGGRWRANPNSARKKFVKKK